MGYTLATGGGSFRIANGALSSKIRQSPLEISNECSIFAYEEGDFVVAEIKSVTQSLYDTIKLGGNIVITLKVYNNLKKQRGYRTAYSSPENAFHQWGFVSVSTQRVSLFRNKYYFPKKAFICDRDTILSLDGDYNFPTSNKLKRLLEHNLEYHDKAYYKIRIELQNFFCYGKPLVNYIQSSDQDVVYNSAREIHENITCSPIATNGQACNYSTGLYSNELKIYI